MPKWATPRRKARLLRMTAALLSLGHNSILALPVYERKVDAAIEGWMEDDRLQREALWRLERGRMHQVPDRKFRQGRFDTVRRAEFLEQQPSYYLVGLGVDALTFRPVAQVRIASTHVHLFVDVGEALQGMSRNAKRKARRYRGLTPEATATVGRLVQKAVADWWNRKR